MENLTLHHEGEVLHELSQGCEKAFEQVYTHYSPRLYGKLFRLLKSEALVEELLQDVFLAVWKNRQNIDPARSFCAYLFCIATNKAYDLFRRSVRNRRLLEHLARQGMTPCEAPESVLMRRELLGNVREAIDLLPPKRRQVFLLCKVDGKSYEEVSCALGISTSTISDHIVKANLFLKNYFLHLDT